MLMSSRFHARSGHRFIGIVLLSVLVLLGLPRLAYSDTPTQPTPQAIGKTIIVAFDSPASTRFDLVETIETTARRVVTGLEVIALHTPITTREEVQEAL